MKETTNTYVAPHAEIIEVDLQVLTLWSGGGQSFNGGAEETTTYPADESKEW